MLNHHKLKDRPRDFLAATGLTLPAFQTLLPAFQAAYETLYVNERTRAGKPRQRRAGGGAKGVLHALQFDLRQPQAHYWMHQLLPVLQDALAALGLAPERNASRLARHPLLLAGAPALVLDGTERRRQRPIDAQRQKAHDSGTQKAHTDTNLLLVNETTSKVVYLSPTIAGKTHDKKAADQAEMAYPLNATLDKDTGFQGYEPDRVLTTQPQKASRPDVESWGEAAQQSFLQGTCDRRTCAGWGQTVSDCQRCLAAHHRRDFGLRDGNRLWFA
jgi:hypothetical protein